MSEQAKITAVGVAAHLEELVAVHRRIARALEAINGNLDSLAACADVTGYGDAVLDVTIRD